MRSAQINQPKSPQHQGFVFTALASLVLVACNGSSGNQSNGGAGGLSSGGGGPGGRSGGASQTGSGGRGGQGGTATQGGAGREPAEARGEARLVRGVVVDRPAAGEGLPPRAAVGWREVGVREAAPVKVALGLPPRAAVGWREVGEAPLVKVALADGRAVPKPEAVDNRVAAAQQALEEPPPDRV